VGKGGEGRAARDCVAGELILAVAKGRYVAAVRTSETVGGVVGREEELEFLGGFLADIGGSSLL
jgi:hypothetical protein